MDNVKCERCPVTGKISCKKKISCNKCFKFQKHLIGVLSYSEQLKRKFSYEKYNKRKSFI